MIEMEDRKLQGKLLALLEKDQRLRQPGAKMNLAMDRSNTQALKKIINNSGWPKISVVGEEAAKAAWYVAVHSPDLRFKKKCLVLLRKAVRNREASGRLIPYLVDKICVHERRSQLYGTQFDIDMRTNTFTPYRVARPDKLEERRKKYSLGKFKYWTALKNPGGAHRGTRA